MLTQRLSYGRGTIDRIHLKIKLTNDTGEVLPVKYQVSRTQPFIQNPEEYDMAVTGFVIPTGSIPAFIFPTLPIDYLYVSLVDSATGAVFQERVVQLDSNTGPPLTEGFVYNVRNFLNSVNIAFANAYAALIAAIPDSPATSPPFMLYDYEQGNQTQLFSLVAPSAGYSEDSTYEADTSPVKIYMNTNLYQLFKNFDVFATRSTGEQDFQILVYPYGNAAAPSNIYDPPTIDSGTMLQMLQQGANPNRILSAQKFVITSALLPVERSLINGLGSEYSSSNLVEPIIVDYTIGTEANDSPIQSKYIVYKPKTLLKYPMFGTAALSAFDINAVWISNEIPSVTRAMYLATGETFELEMQFSKKNLPN
jgi:hypothetical protein